MVVFDPRAAPSFTPISDACLFEAVCFRVGTGSLRRENTRIGSDTKWWLWLKAKKNPAKRPERYGWHEHEMKRNTFCNLTLDSLTMGRL